MKRLALITLILFCTARAFPQEGLQSGEITELTGTVELKHPGQTDFTPAKVRDKLTKDTIVSTGFKSNALIRVGSAILTVRPLTRLSLSEISSSEGTEKLNLSLQAGRIRVDVKPPAGTRTSMSFVSPMATAAVRGTSFEFDIDSLTVLEGKVIFKGSQDAEIPVSAGTSSGINEYGRPFIPAETYATGLRPVPPAGVEAGYREGGTFVPGFFDSSGNFGLIINYN